MAGKPSVYGYQEVFVHMCTNHRYITSRLFANLQKCIVFEYIYKRGEEYKQQGCMSDMSFKGNLCQTV